MTKKQKKMLIIAGIILAVLLVVILVIRAVTGKGSGSDKAKNFLTNRFLFLIIIFACEFHIYILSEYGVVW